MDMELRHLRCFVAVAEHQNVTRAAAALHLTQPTVSRSVAALERIVGTVLLDRASSGVALTADGAEFARRAQDLVAEADSLQRAFASSAELRIGFSWMLPTPWWGHLRRAPDMATLTPVRFDDPVAALRRGDVDLVVSRRHGDDDGLDTCLVFTEPRIAVVSSQSPLATRAEIGWDELGTYPLVVNALTGTTTEGSWKSAPKDRKVVRCRNFDEWIELIAANAGVGAAPQLAATRSPHPDVVYLPVADAPASPVLLVWRTGTLNEGMRHLIDTAHQVAAD